MLPGGDTDEADLLKQVGCLSLKTSIHEKTQEGFTSCSIGEGGYGGSCKNSAGGRGGASKFP